jgi:hypothetical protein
VIEDHVVDLLQASGFAIETRDPKTRDQFRVAGFGGRLVGHLDGRITLGSKPADQRQAILEIKSAKASRFEDLLPVGYEAWSPKYADQIQCYMGFSKIHEALVVVYCKDDSRIFAERLKLDPDRYKALWSKAKRIITSEQVLPRPAEAVSQYCGFCKWCPRNEWCWGPLSEIHFDA